MESVFAHPPVPQTGQRALMARFSHGAEHERRRGYALAAIASFDVERVRACAGEAAKRAATGTVDVIPLARAIISDIFAVTDEPDDPEIAANRHGLRIQALDATTGLIANALIGRRSVGEMLKADPPVINTRRIIDGEEVVIDIRDRPFGGEPRPCPGQELALAIAEAVVEVMRTGELQPFDGVYEDWPNMRIPARVEVVFA